jgi:hypothetical protein
MALYIGDISFKTIKKEYEDSLRKLNPDVILRNKGGKGNPLAFFNSRLYRLFTASIFKALNSLEKGKNQQYYKYINQSAGDYSKRKGGNVATQMASHAEFINSFIKKEKNENLEYSLLGIFVDIFNILEDQKWKSAFKRAFMHVDKTGATNTVVSAFKMIYIALVITFEAIGLKMLSFEYDVHTGIDPETAILNIMKLHSSFMKSVTLPMIKVICICELINDPLKMVNEIISDENTVKEAKKKAREAGYPYKVEENGLSALESFKIERMDNILCNKNKSTESGLLAAVTTALYSIFSTTAAGSAVTTAVLPGGSLAAGAAAASINPITAAILLCSVIIILILIAIPTARLIIYWVNVKKVDIQKDLEMQAELLNNNIILLQEKLEKTTNKEERARLQNIITRQIEMLVKLQNDIRKYLDDEYEAAVDAKKEAENDENSLDSNGDDDEGNNDDFEVSI